MLVLSRFVPRILPRVHAWPVRSVCDCHSVPPSSNKTEAKIGDDIDLTTSPLPRIGRHVAHVFIATPGSLSAEDWPSRVESPLSRRLSHFLLRRDRTGGRVLVNHVAPPGLAGSEEGRTEVLTFPAGRRVSLSPAELEDVDLASLVDPTSKLGDPIETPVAFVCGHAARDARCGRVASPIRDALRHAAVPVCLTDHTGGHKFAGNVILQLPGGRSVWYSRMHAGNVGQVVRETLAGRVSGEHCRYDSLVDNPRLSTGAEKQ